ncbi:MAG: adenylate/guanylate cyclase domain-containing protein [Alphaproteobacteria bacterium]
MSRRPLTSTVLFADICDSTRLYDQHGDDTAYRVVSGALARVVESIESYEGTLIKAIGDGVIAIFPEPDKALLSATAIVTPSDDDPLTLRAGLHFGPLIMVDGDVFGDVVNVASRVVSLAQAGEVLLTGEVREALTAILRTGLGFLDAISVKGKPEPIQIYRLVAGQTDATIVGAPTTVEMAARAALEVSAAGQTVRLSGPNARLVIGRQPDCDLVVQGPLISRQHARIEQAHGDFFIHDSSANGTFVQQTGGAMIALRRNSAPLGREGRISLGTSLASEDGTTLSYRVIAD